MQDVYPLMPPADLILQNGIGAEPGTDIIRLFDEIGRGLIAEMIRDRFLEPHHRVLEVGCGLGRLARALTGFLAAPGSYCGIDVVRSSIDWCVENYRNFPHFEFIHADVFNTHYNPQSTVRATNYRFPFPDAEFHRVYSTSLYTHMLPLDFAAYIGEMTRVLKPGGLMWNSYLLLDEVSGPLSSTFNPPFAYLPIKIHNGRFALQDDPEALTGIDASFVKVIHRANGLKISEVRNGPWSGRKDNLTASYQDIVIASKP